jgi:hypothetical protein
MARFKCVSRLDAVILVEEEVVEAGKESDCRVELDVMEEG